VEVDAPLLGNDLDDVGKEKESSHFVYLENLFLRQEEQRATEKQVLFVKT
jgi:hypothetical protein